MAHDTGDLLAGRGGAIGKPGLARDLRANRVQLALAERVEHPAIEHRPFAETARQPFLDEMVGARVHRAPHLGAKPAARDVGAALDQPMIEPGRAGRFHLCGKVKVGPRCEDQRRLLLAGPPDRAQLDEAAELRCVLQRLDTGQPDMVGAPVRAVDHGIGGAGQLVVQPLVDQPAGDRLLGRAADDGVAVERSILPVFFKCRANRADNVAARAQFAQLHLRALRHHPLTRIALSCEPHRFQVLQAPDHQTAEPRIVRAGALGAQVDHAQLVGGTLDFGIAPGPAFRRYFAIERALHLMFGLRPELGKRQVLRARAEIVADIVAGDDEIGAGVGDAAHEQMDVRIVGVPVIDRDPIERRAQVGLHLPHEVARVFAQVGQLGGVFGRYDDPEMVPVIFAPLGETAIVGVVVGRVEHPGR